MKLIPTLLPCLILFAGCRHEKALAHYEGHWKLDPTFVEEKKDTTKMEPEAYALLVQEFGLDTLEWTIRDGAIYGGGPDDFDSKPMSVEVFEDNINFAEVLVHNPVLGHIVLRLKLRDGHLNVYSNVSRQLFHRFIRADEATSPPNAE